MDIPAHKRDLEQQRYNLLSENNVLSSDINVLKVVIKSNSKRIDHLNEQIETFTALIQSNDSQREESPSNNS